MELALRQKNNSVAPIYPGEIPSENGTTPRPTSPGSGKNVLPPLKNEIVAESNGIHKEYHNSSQARDDDDDQPPASLAPVDGDDHSVVFTNGRAGGSSSANEVEKGSDHADKRANGGELHLTFYEAMGPLFFGMELFGLWHTSTIYNRSRPADELKNRPTWKKIFNKPNYSIFVLILIWFNFLRFFPAFFVGAVLEPARLIFKVIYAVFLLQCGLNTTAMLISTTRKGMMDTFFQHWEERVQSRDETKVDLKWVHKWSKAFAILAYIFIFLHFVNQANGVFGPLESVRNATNAFAAPFTASYGIHLVFLIINVFNFASWIFPIFFFIQICIIMERQFGDFTDRFEKAMEHAYESGGLPVNFEDLRYQHQELCFLVEASNNGLFTLFSAIAYLTMLPLACFMIYQLLFSFDQYTDNVPAIIMYVIWLTSIFVNVPVVSWIAALVNTKAHAPLEAIYKVRAGPRATNQNVMQMNMFLARLNGSEVAYTVFDLIKLTKPFILTIAGLAVTYFALLVEFQN